MRKPITGIVEFREHRLPQYAEQFSKLALGQTADALFITCSATGSFSTCWPRPIRATFSSCAMLEI